MKNKTEQGKESLSVDDLRGQIHRQRLDYARRTGILPGLTCNGQLIEPPRAYPPVKPGQPVGFDRYVRTTPAPHAAVPLSPQHRTVLPTYAYRTVWRYNYQSGGWVPNGFAGPRR